MTSSASRPGPTGQRLVSRARFDRALAALYGFVVVATIAGSAGGYRATTWAWTAVLTLWLATAVVLARKDVQLGRLDWLFAGGLVLFGCWVALSNLWTPSVPSTMREAQRMLAYVGIVAAGLLVVRSRTMRHLLGGALGGIAVLSAYGLATRLLPDHFGTFESVSFGYRLAAPITHWNGLGLFAVMGLLLALGFAARGRNPLTRAVAAGLLPLLAATMYFTFSRGAWFALVIGLVVAVILDPRRLQFLAVALCLAPWVALAIASGEARDGLTTTGATLAEATSDGHSFAVLLFALCAGAALAGFLLAFLERRIAIPSAAREVFAALLIAVVVLAAAWVWTTEGSPWRLTERVWDAFDAPPAGRGAPDDASARLLTLSGNGRGSLWRVSWRTFEAAPAVGDGAGTYWQAWARERDIPLDSLDTHSLYLEALGELGVVGLALLLTVLAIPVRAAARARHRELVPAAAGAYVAWAAHAGVDWYWELIGVSATALLCGIALLAAARQRRRLQTTPFRSRLALACVIGALCLIGIPPLVSETALSAAYGQLGEQPAEALDNGRRARRWAPWASDPDRLIGDAYAALGRKQRALQSYRDALAKDRSSWALWQAVSLYSTGNERERAQMELRRLNPIIATDPPSTSAHPLSTAFLAAMGEFATNEWLCHRTGDERTPTGWESIQLSNLAVYEAHVGHPDDHGPYPGKPSGQNCADRQT